MQFELWRDLIRSDRASMARIALLTGFSPAFLSSLDEAALTQNIDFMLDNINWEGMARQIELDRTLNVCEQARRITRPALVIGCRHDQMVPVDHAHRLAALIPHAEYAEMETGHIALWERPDEFIELACGFLRRHAA
jgi:pimeloyl-ACP methyl ester carboxylesterase